MKDSFIFYRSFYEAIKDLNNKDQLNLFLAICELSLNEEDTEIDGIANTIFKLMKPQILANNRRYENGKKGGAPKGNDNAKKQPKNNLDTTKKQPNNNVNENVNVNDNKKENIKRKSFEKPTIEEIQNYCSERNNGINANAFYDFYESKNWMVGKNKMKDWKACVRTWEQRNESNKKTIVPSWFNQEIKEEEFEFSDEDKKRFGLT